MKILKTPLLFIILLFTACNKRPFAHIEVTGQIVSVRTGQPVQRRIQLWVGDQYAGSKGTFMFGDVSTGGAGFFDIKSHAQWNGNSYWLLLIPVDTLSDPQVRTMELQIKRGQKIDLGIISL